MNSPAETLCQACGLCCNGTLHNFTYLRYDEDALARDLGLRVRVRRDGITLFLQPCAAYHPPDCTVYADRPFACRQYTCRLLLSLETHAVDLPAAIATAAQAKALIAKLRSFIPDPAPYLSLDQQVKTLWSPAQPLPESVAPIFTELAALLNLHYGVRWLRRKSRFQRWKRRLQSGMHHSP